MATRRRAPAQADLQRVVDETARLMSADGAIVYLLDERAGVLRWKRDAGITSVLARERVRKVRLLPGVGVVGGATSSGNTRRTGDYLADDSFTHGEVADGLVREIGIRSMMAAPLIAGGPALGALAVYARRRNAFDDEVGARLLRILADHAAASIANERLIRELRASSRELARRVEAQRTLTEIATGISGLRDPGSVLQRTVDATVRLLGAEAALLNPLVDSSLLGPAVAHAPADEPLDDVAVPGGLGISGRALTERRVVATRDYLEDPSFEHTPEIDNYIRRIGMRSVMSAPLIGVEGPIGVLTVQARRADAFGGDAEEVLGAMASQAAIAITSSRLYAQVAESERRYRHLIETSPDVVWSADAEGVVTYISESWARLTGRRPEAAIGERWDAFTDSDSVAIARSGWAALQAHPDREHRMRIEVSADDGTLIPVEINMIAEQTNGRFAGAHGALRDVRDRERLEADLRRQAGELAAASERARLAQELHDSVTQALFSMTMTARSAELLLDRDTDAARTRLRELRELQRDALTEMRSLIFELRPGNIEAEGLVEALRGHAAAVAGRTGLAVQVDAEPGDRLPIDLEHALFRVAQEALHNAVKHASAREVRIGLRRHASHTDLFVEDDGVGFDPDMVPSERLGLAGMRTRIEGVGGALSVESRAGCTRVEAVVPTTLQRMVP